MRSCPLCGVPGRRAKPLAHRWHSAGPPNVLSLRVLMGWNTFFFLVRREDNTYHHHWHNPATQVGDGGGACLRADDGPWTSCSPPGKTCIHPPPGQNTRRNQIGLASTLGHSRSWSYKERQGKGQAQGDTKKYKAKQNTPGFGKTKTTVPCKLI